jgi:hypothetical protein
LAPKLPRPARENNHSGLLFCRLTVFRPATKICPNFEAKRLQIQEASVAQGYCVKCKAKKEIANAQEITMKNGRPAIQGVCPDCGTKIFCMQGGKK